MLSPNPNSTSNKPNGDDNHDEQHRRLAGFYNNTSLANKCDRELTRLRAPTVWFSILAPGLGSHLTKICKTRKLHATKACIQNLDGPFLISTPGPRARMLKTEGPVWSSMWRRLISGVENYLAFRPNPNQEAIVWRRLCLLGAGNRSFQASKSLRVYSTMVITGPEGVVATPNSTVASRR